MRTKIRIHYLTIIIFAITLCFSMPVKAKTNNSQQYSLLISGTSNSNKDIKTMAKILKTNKLKKSGVTYLLKKKKYKITPTIWDQCIKKAFSKSKKNDICYFYYSGHSFLDHLGFSINNDRVVMYSYRKLINTLNKNCKGKVVVILDTCFSEQIIEEYKSMNPSKKMRKKFHFMVASKENENASYALFSNGAYTKRLNKSFKKKKGYYAADSNKDKKITLSELHWCINRQFLKSKLKDKQHPDYLGSPDTVIFKY